MLSASFLLRSFAICLALIAVPVHAAPDKAARFYEDALSRYQRKDLAGAVIQLKNALQQDNKMLAVHVLLGRSLLGLGDAAGAEVEFSAALALGVDRAEVELPLLQALYAQGRYNDLLARPLPPGLPERVRIELLVIRGSAEGELNDARAAARSFAAARAINPKSPVLAMAEASQALRSGDVPRALELSLSAVTAEPENADAWAGRGAALLAQGQVKPAMDAFERALALNPRLIEARLARVDAWIGLSRDGDAAKELVQAQAIADDDPRVSYRKGLLAARRGDSAGVAREMTDVVKSIDAIPPEIRNRRADLLLLGGMAHYSLRDPEKARISFENFLRLQPYHPGATRMLASVYLGVRDPKRAVDLLEDYLKRAPKDAQAMTLLASAYLVQKRYPKATNLLQQAVDQGGDASLRAALGASLAGQGQDANAAIQLRAAFDAIPGDAATGSALAVLLLQRGQAKEAVAVMEKVLATDPGNPIASNLLGLAKVQSGDRAGARKAYEAAIAADGRFVPAALNLARLELIESRPERARQRLVALLRDRNDNVDALCDLAALDLREGKRESARKGLERAVSIAPRRPRAPLLLIDDAIGHGEFPRAIEVARTAAADMPDNVAVLLALARAQLASGNPARARDVLADARKRVEFDPAALVEIARMQIAAGHLQGAAYSIEKALTADPGDFRALELQAEVALRENDLANAERLARRLSDKFPGRAAGQQILGDVALTKGQTAAGVAFHRAAFQREPGTEVALRVFRAYVMANDIAKGIAFLQEYQRGKGAGDRRIAESIAEGQIQAGDWTGARLSIEALLKQGERAGLLNNYALVLLQLNDAAAATAAAERAWKLSPADPQMIDTLGWVLVRSGQVERGLGLLRDVRLRDPRNPEVRFHLAWVLAKQGRAREARDELAPVSAELARVGSPQEARKLARELGL